MTDFDRQPGAIDDPGMKGGIDPQLDRLPPGSRADDTGEDDSEPQASELDLPGPNDPVAWASAQAAGSVRWSSSAIRAVCSPGAYLHRPHGWI